MNRKLLVILALVVIAGVLYLRSRGWEFDWSLFLASFRNVKAGWMAASVVATFATYLIRAIRWQVLLESLKAIRLDTLMLATLVGFSAIYILGRPGEFVRPVWVSRKERLPLTGSIATIVVERFLDSLMIVLFFAATLLVVELPPSAQAAGPIAAMKDVAKILVVSSIAVMGALFFFRSNIDHISGRIPYKKVKSLLHNFAQGLSFLQSRRSFGITLFQSLLLWFVIALQFWFMMLGMNFNFSLAGSTLVMVGAAIGSIAQVPGIGGGFQAGFVFCLSTFFAVPAEKAVAASLIAWVLSYVPTVGIAALYMLFTGISLKDLRGLETT